MSTGAAGNWSRKSAKRSGDQGSSSTSQPTTTSLQASSKLSFASSISARYCERETVPELEAHAQRLGALDPAD